MPSPRPTLYAARRTIAPNRQQAKPRPEPVPADRWQPSVMVVTRELLRYAPGSEAAEEVLNSVLDK